MSRTAHGVRPARLQQFRIRSTTDIEGAPEEGR